MGGCFICRHRLATVRHAHVILVLVKSKDGCTEIAERGTHDELMSLDGIYADLWKKSIGEKGRKKKQEDDEMSIEELFKPTDT